MRMSACTARSTNATACYADADLPSSRKAIRTSQPVAVGVSISIKQALRYLPHTHLTADGTMPMATAVMVVQLVGFSKVDVAEPAVEMSRALDEVLC